MKQVLSVADFATIMSIVDREIERFNWKPTKMEWVETEKQYQERLKAVEKTRESQEYKNLLHLKESLQNLNIEVECPDVEIKGEQK